VECRHTIRLDLLLLSLDDQATILNVDVNVLRLNVLGYGELHLHAFAAVLAVADLREEVVVHMTLGLLERHFDDELSLASHERHHLVAFGMRRHRICLFEFLDVEIACLGLLGLLTANNRQLITLPFGLDR